MTSKKTPSKAVIYCRVSSLKQVKEGHGLESQESRCREFAKHKNYQVIEVFYDEGISGSLIERPSMQKMLSFLEQQPEPCIVLIDDISRLARGLEAHIQLRTTISSAGGLLESPSIEFGDDSDSRLVENLLASVSQHSRQKNTEQVINRMRARALNGYWISNPSTGYRFEMIDGHGKLLVRDEPVASIVQEALEGFASGRFESQSEVKCFLEAQAGFPKNRNGEVHYQRVSDLLSRVLYAGYIKLPTWGIHLQPAKHEPLISYDTFLRIQKRLNSHAKAPARKDINDDFPLRGFVTCGCCNKPMTSCWSQSSTKKKYAYYLCAQKGCELKGKSIPRNKVEDEFEQLLQDVIPSQNLFYLAVDMFRDLWKHRQTRFEANGVAFEKEKSTTTLKIEKLVNRILDSNSPTLIETYEKAIQNLESNKARLSEKMHNNEQKLPDFDKTFRTAMKFLSNPHKLWLSESMEDKRTALKLVFAGKLQYDRNEGFRTPSMSLPFLVTGDIEGGRYEMVGPPRFERGTCRL